MSASSTPTFWPEAASAAARLTVTDDLPTPPLPLAIANTWVSEDGWANGISRSWRPPRSWVCSSRRCSSLITSRSTVTPDTPGTAATAAVTSRVMVSRSGHPETVRYTSTRTLPSAATLTLFTMPSSVIGRRISGSLTRASASVTCSVLGGGVSANVLMGSCYSAPVLDLTVKGGTTQLFLPAPDSHATVKRWVHPLPVRLRGRAGKPCRNAPTAGRVRSPPAAAPR